MEQLILNPTTAPWMDALGGQPPKVWMLLLTLVLNMAEQPAADDLEAVVVSCPLTGTAAQDQLLNFEAPKFPIYSEGTLQKRHHDGIMPPQSAL